MADSTARRLIRRRTPAPAVPAAAPSGPSVGSGLAAPEGTAELLVRPPVPSTARFGPAPAPITGASSSSGRSGPRGERTVTVAVRLTPIEQAAWLAAAERDGRVQLGRWVRERITGQLERRPARTMVSPELVEQVARLRSDLSKVGSNLNQIARALNVAARGGEAAPPPAEVLAAVDAVRVELAAVRDRLSGVRG